MKKSVFFEYSLAIEEFAVSMGLAGRPEEAKGLLLSQFGMLPTDEERGRLLSANHSLLARNLLSIVNGAPELSKELTHVISLLFSTTRLCRFGRTGKFGEDILTYHYSSDGLLEHVITDGIVHSFRTPIRMQDVENRVSAFFSPISNDKNTDLSLELPITFITTFDFTELRMFDKVLETITQSEVKSKSANAFAQDLAKGNWRGSMIWIDNEFKDRTFGRGSFCLQGAEHLWLINSIENSDPPKLRAYRCTKDQFREHIRSLVATTPPV